MSALIFIDTNILLDFYRIPGREGALSILERIDAHRDVIITTDQVEMEYKKNRQKVILAWYRGQSFDAGGLQLPPIVARMKASKAMSVNRKRFKKQAEKVRERLAAVLRAPSRNDPVFRVLQRLFSHVGPYNLSPDKAAHAQVAELAQARHTLGFPPRKPDDTSSGDAINWEWIVQCAQNSRKDIVIASRDSDYGINFEGPVLNDWLADEFKTRVGKKRRIVLTDRLSDAFKRASIAVPKKAEAAEIDLLKLAERITAHGGQTILSALADSPSAGLSVLGGSHLVNLGLGTQMPTYLSTHLSTALPQLGGLLFPNEPSDDKK